MHAYTVTLTNPEVLRHVQSQAARLHVTVDEYVNKVLVHVTQTAPERVPTHVLKRWEKEIAEFEAEDKQNPRPEFTSGDDYINYIRHTT